MAIIAAICRKPTAATIVSETGVSTPAHRPVPAPATFPAPSIKHEPTNITRPLDAALAPALAWPKRLEGRPLEARNLHHIAGNSPAPLTTIEKSPLPICLPTNVSQTRNESPFPFRAMQLGIPLETYPKSVVNITFIYGLNLLVSSARLGTITELGTLMKLNSITFTICFQSISYGYIGIIVRDRQTDRQRDGQADIKTWLNRIG